MVVALDFKIFENRPLTHYGQRLTVSSCTAPISSGPAVHYVVIRNDLPLGFLTAQVVHAAGESSPGQMSPGTNAVVLAVPDEEMLAAVHQRLMLAGIACKAIFEPDPPWLGQMTAVGVCPTRERAKVRRVLSSLPLFGQRHSNGEISKHRPGNTGTDS